MKTRIALACVISSFMAFGLIGCGGDDDNNTAGGNNAGGASGGDSGSGGDNDDGAGGEGSEDSPLCEQRCTKLAEADCENKVDKAKCMSTCAKVMEGISANTDCRNSLDALYDCHNKLHTICDKDGKPGFLDDVCKTEKVANFLCISKYMNEPKCNEWCDKRIAANCGADEFKDKDKCVKLCQGFILFSIVSKDCWPKWNSYLDCVAVSDHTCSVNNKPIVAACDPKGLDFATCMGIVVQ